MLAATVLFSKEKSKDQDELPRRKWWLLPAVVLVALIACGFASLKLYRHFEPQRLARRAKEMMQAGDFRGAALTLRRAIQINAGSYDATRLMADLMESMHASQAIVWRRRTAALNPTALTDAFSWADLALREGQNDVANEALETVPVEKRNAGWHSRAGLAAIRSGHWKAAGERFREAARLEPENELHQYNLALVQIQSNDPKERETGFAALDRPDLQGRIRVVSQRTIVAELNRQGRTADALEHSTALVAMEDAELPDHLAHLDLLLKLKQDYSGSLAAAKDKAIQHPSDTAVLIQWFRLRGRAEDALAWVKEVPEAIAADSAVQAARGDCLLAVGNWDELKASAIDADWASANVHRLALLAYASAQLGDHNSASSLWESAVRQAGTKRGELSQLAVLADNWGWKAELRQALWAAAESPGPAWALKILHGSYMADGDTANVLRVAQRQFGIDPTDLKALNNIVHCELLLQTDLDLTMKKAQDLAARAPDDPIIRSTYAFALLANGWIEEALAQIGSIPKERLKEPSLAFYHALIEAANGHADRARELFQASEKATLLPEEKALRIAAQAGN
jgi:tetratricopeptide (TPR) repeat protein